MISDARGTHVSPGIYTEERDVTYSVKSLGITNLGLVGETLYGPAFQNIEIEDWTSFVDYFGGTSPEKFKGTGLPKYELPYIAKSYLEKSKQLNVVRVLGLSGYHAGPAWVINTSDDQAQRPLVVLRSKMTYANKPGDINDFCNQDEDKSTAIVESIEIGPYNPVGYESECVKTDATTSGLNMDKKFSIIVTVKDEYTTPYKEEQGVEWYVYNSSYTYNVSLNQADSDYIYKVLSSSPDTGTTPVYIEAVYENSYRYYAKVDGSIVGNELGYRTYAEAEKVVKLNLTENYSSSAVTHSEISNTINDIEDIVTGETGDTYSIYDDYREIYRPAQTPWFVSEAYASSIETSNGGGNEQNDNGGDNSGNENSGATDNQGGEDNGGINDNQGGGAKSGDTASKKVMVTMKKLFKFITISDGNASNYQVKVSIQRINPKLGTFDVLVRDYNDTDNSPIVLEKFSNCTLNQGDESFLPYKIGSADGGFVAKSKYITVQMATEEDLSGSVPCGFLGFPVPDYETKDGVLADYNTLFNASEKVRSQYFGMTNKLVDEDLLKYKGIGFYKNENGDDNPEGITAGFHMDSILSKSDAENIYVDGTSGYNFISVSTEKVSGDEYIPRIINAPYMNETIYKDEKVRKFTCYFYGGFDGWDVNRKSRTNTDEYKASMYNVGNSSIFKKVDLNELNIPLMLPETAITSDYYAYLAGYNIFANPQDIDINLFATPGIDWYRNKLLTLDVIDLIEDGEDGRGGDALYIMDAPNNPIVDKLINDFNETEINSSYACTYYPWVMYYDQSNRAYVNLPVTKDVVRNMAETDNNDAPWFAAAGISRGDVDCINANIKTTLQIEDSLYQNRINPIKTFARDGVKVWGNKTAYSVDSPLNRINVRRLMIRVKKLVTEAARHLIFEQYTDTLEKQFRGLVEPILAEVKSKRGIYDYRIKTEVTPETRDQHILPCRILIKPTSALEYISISFVVYPESISFED